MHIFWNVALVLATSMVHMCGNVNAWQELLALVWRLNVMALLIC